MIPVVRYIFIYEGKEGSSPIRDAVVRQMKELDNGVEYDFYAAADAEDALRHVSLFCDLHKDIAACFVSCGGEALTAGIAGGLMGSGEGKTLALFDPEGANALGKNYEGKDFGSIAKLMGGSPVPVDMIRVNNSYTLNSCAFGLEELLEEKGFIQSLGAFIRQSFRSVRISADGVALDTGPLLFFSVSNGRYAGRGLCISPQALIDDGRLDLCGARTMSPSKSSRLQSALLAGTLADEQAFAGDLVLRRAKTVEIVSSKDITLALDGPSLTGKEFRIKVVPGAISLIIPSDQAYGEVTG